MEKTRTCTTCRRRKRVKCFSGEKRICKGCKATYNRSWYERNKKKHKADVERNRARYRREMRELIGSLKSVSCADCGERYPVYVMDFDHRDPATKKANVSRMAATGSAIRTVLEEAAKCDVVCANCHRERTFGPRSTMESAVAS